MPEDTPGYQPHVVLTKQELEEVVEAYLGFDYFVFDLETVGGREKRFSKDKPALDERTNQVLWMSMAGPGRSDVIPMGHPTITDKAKKVHEAPLQLRRGLVLEVCRPLFFSQTIRKVNANVKFDLLTLTKYYGAVPPGPLADLQTLYHVWSSEVSGGFKLGNLSKIYLGYVYRKLAREGAIDSFPFWDVAHYVGLDSQVAHLLWCLLRPTVASRPQLEAIFEMEEELTEVSLHMKYHGITVDRPGLEALSTDLAVRIKQADTAVRSHVPAEWTSPNKTLAFNPQSTPHMQKLLYTDLNLPVVKLSKVTGDPSSDKFALDILRLSHPIIDDLRDLRDLSKLRSTYVTGALERTDPDGRLRADFKQCGAATGRWSCSGPNLQNLPSANDLAADDGQKIRHMFMAAPGYVLVGADYSQIEGRVFGHLCAESGAGNSLRDIFLEPDVDWHRATAARMYDIAPENVTDKQRAKGKTANFALLYGGYWTLLISKFKMGKTEAQETYERFHAAYPELQAYLEIVCTAARNRRKPYTETIWGRRRYLPDLNLPVYGEGEDRKKRYMKRKSAELEAVNHTVQGSSADVTKSAMVRWWRRTERLDRRGTWRLLVTEHDALYTEIPLQDRELGIETLREAMEGVKIKLSVPIPVQVKAGNRWSDVK